MIPRPVVRGADGRCASPVAIPLYPPGRYGRATAGYVDRPQAATGSRHRPGTAPGPGGDRTRAKSSLDRDRELTCLFLRRHSCEIKDL